jgi:hypothetical protein
MSALTNSLKTSIAKYLSISTRIISEVTIITALPYSGHAIEVIEKTFQSDGLSGLSKIDHNKLEDNADSILVCKCLLNDNRSFVSLVFDPEELYQSANILKLIPI